VQIKPALFGSLAKKTTIVGWGLRPGRAHSAKSAFFRAHLGQQNAPEDDQKPQKLIIAQMWVGGQVGGCGYFAAYFI